MPLNRHLIPAVALLGSLATAIVAYRVVQEQRFLLKDAVRVRMVVLEHYERPPQGIWDPKWKRAMLVEITEKGSSTREERPVRDFSEVPIGKSFSAYYIPGSTGAAFSADFLPIWGPSCAWGFTAVTLFVVGVVGFRRRPSKK